MGMRTTSAGARTPTLRWRLLAGILVPSVVLLVGGGALGANLVQEAVQQQQRTERLAAGIELRFFTTLIEERDASLLYLADPTAENRERVRADRAAVDEFAAPFVASIDAVSGQLTDSVRDTVAGFVVLMNQLPQLRAQVDRGGTARIEVYRGYNQITEAPASLIALVGAVAYETSSTNDYNRAADLVEVGALLGRSNALLAAGLTARDLSPADYEEFAHTNSTAQTRLVGILPLLSPQERDQVGELMAGPQWQEITRTTNAWISGGYQAARGIDPADAERLDVIATEVATSLQTIGYTRLGGAVQTDSANAAAVVRTSTITALVFLAGLVAAIVIAFLVTARLVRRLGALRRDTFDLAETALPATIARLRTGGHIDLETELPALDHGRDEIGQVAEAFNHAQRAAVEVAVREAQTREGFNSAFLNIARRSQTILHQQIQVLDRMQRKDNEPDQLELIYSLDHLATRERRNAENLIILGGEQPRRQWRNPIAVTDVVRAAISESEQYKRISIGVLPDVMVVGRVVGDLVHLLAELVDNATAFSPPTSPIEVHGNLVGRGVLIEVEDQGLGIEEGQVAELNLMLSRPPEFGLFTLSRDSRVGLFVVSHLANRHGIKVAMRNSAYGGIRAGVMVPTSAIDGESSSDVDSPTLRTARVERRADAGPGDGTGNRVQPVTVPAAVAMPQAGEDGRPIPVPRHAGDAGGRPGSGGAHAAVAGTADGLPGLPRRRRQTHVDSRLAVPPPRQEAESPQPVHNLFALPEAHQHPDGYSPETARTRMAALQRGSAQARADDEGTDGGGRS